MPPAQHEQSPPKIGRPRWRSIAVRKFQRPRLAQVRRVETAVDTSANREPDPRSCSASAIAPELICRATLPATLTTPSVKLRGLERAPTHLRRSKAVLHCADDEVADRPQADHETRVCWAMPGLRNAHERFTQRSIPNREASPSTLAEHRLLEPAGVALDRPRAGIPSC